MLLTRHLHSWQYLLIFGRAVAVSQQQACYAPNGLPSQGNFPCFLDQDESPCCGPGSICEASGLCKVAGSTGVSELIRGTCTDPTWNSPECPQYCIVPDGITGGINLISCQNATNSALDFCCDHTNGCCDSGIGRFQVPLNTDVVTIGTLGATVSTFATTSTLSSSSQSTVATTSSSSSARSSSTTSSTLVSSGKTSSTPISSGTTSSVPPSTSAVSTTDTAPISTPSNESNTNTPAISEKSTGLSTAAVAGITVGGTIAGIALVGGLAYYFLRKRGPWGSTGTKAAQLEKSDYSTLSLFHSAPLQTHPAEMETNWVHHPAELQA